MISAMLISVIWQKSSQYIVWNCLNKMLRVMRLIFDDSKKNRKKILGNNLKWYRSQETLKKKLKILKNK